MTKKDVQEGLMNLFLRLNGYFSTGLIAHSSAHGKNQTELDVLAVRFPFHQQTDRVIECSSYLQIPTDTIDVIIGEVKSGSEQVQFNSALYDNHDSIIKTVEWLGITTDQQKKAFAENLATELKPSDVHVPDKFKILTVKSPTGTFSVRPILFSIDRPAPKRNQTRFVYGQLMLDCFRPEKRRDTCSASYDWNLWGYGLTPIVDYFKDTKRQAVGDMTALYKHFNCEE